jgi:hypothetical protein
MNSILFAAASLEAGGHSPSLSTVLIAVTILGFLLFAGTRVAYKSGSKGRPAERVLTSQTDDKGVPVFFDLSTQKDSAYTAARAASRMQEPRR